jgi:hypothetical protein
VHETSEPRAVVAVVFDRVAQAPIQMLARARVERDARAAGRSKATAARGRDLRSALRLIGLSVGR